MLAFVFTRVHFSLSAAASLTHNPGDDPTAVESGSDLVVISDENDSVVDTVKFDSTNCGHPDQDILLERIKFTGPSDCSNLHAGLMFPDLLLEKRTVSLRKISAILIVFPPPITTKDAIFKEINFVVEDIAQYLKVKKNDCCDIEFDEWSVGDTSLAGGLTACHGDGSDTI